MVLIPTILAELTRDFVVNLATGSRSPIKYGTSFQRDGDALIGRGILTITLRLPRRPSAEGLLAMEVGFCHLFWGYFFYTRFHPHSNPLPWRARELTEGGFVTSFNEIIKNQEPIIKEILNSNIEIRNNIKIQI
jgi:hypothetical protein